MAHVSYRKRSIQNSKTKHSKTKYQKLENEASKTRKRSTVNLKTKHPKLENEASKLNNEESCPWLLAHVLLRKTCYKYVFCSFVKIRAVSKHDYNLFQTNRYCIKQFRIRPTKHCDNFVLHENSTQNLNSLRENISNSLVISACQKICLHGPLRQRLKFGPNCLSFICNGGFQFSIDWPLFWILSLRWSLRFEYYLIFKIGTIYLHGLNERFSFIWSIHSFCFCPACADKSGDFSPFHSIVYVHLPPTYSLRASASFTDRL